MLALAARLRVQLCTISQLSQGTACVAPYLPHGDSVTSIVLILIPPLRTRHMCSYDVLLCVAGAHRLQGVLLFSLTAVALASSPAAERQEAASSASANGAPSEVAAHSLRLIFGTLVPILAVVASFCPAPSALWGKLRRSCWPSSTRWNGGVKQS